MSEPETLAADMPTPQNEHAAVQGPVTELGASMPLLRALQQLLNNNYAQRAFGRDDLNTAARSIFGEHLSLGVFRHKLELGNGVAYETLIRHVLAHGAVQTWGKYRAILTAEAQAQRAAQRAAARQQAAAKEEAQLQTLNQYADVPPPGADLNGSRELLKERRRLELRVSDRYLKISADDAFAMNHIEGLSCEHYVQPVGDHNEAYLRLIVKFQHPVKKSPSQAFKLLGDAIDMTVLPASEAAAAKAKAKAEAEKEFNQRVAGVTVKQCLERKYFRILTAYAYAVPEDSTFYDIAESLQHLTGEFRTDQDRDRAKRKALTSDARGKELTQKAWKDKIVELTGTVAELKQTISSLESGSKRQKAELESLSELKDWELQEDGTMIRVNRTDEQELERMLEEQEAAEAAEQEYWMFQ